MDSGFFHLFPDRTRDLYSRIRSPPGILPHRHHKNTGSRTAGSRFPKLYGCFFVYTFYFPSTAAICSGAGMDRMAPFFVVTR